VEEETNMKNMAAKLRTWWNRIR